MIGGPLHASAHHDAPSTFPQAEKLRRRVADLEGERSQLTHELQHAWDLMMSSPDDVKVSLIAPPVRPAECLSKCL